MKSIVTDEQFVKDVVGYIHYEWDEDYSHSDIVGVSEQTRHSGGCETCDFTFTMMVLHTRDADGNIVELQHDINGYTYPVEYSVETHDVLNWVAAGRPPRQIMWNTHNDDIISEFINTHKVAKNFTKDYTTQLNADQVDRAESGFYIEVYYDEVCCAAYIFVDGVEYTFDHDTQAELGEIAKSHNYWQ